MKGANHMKEIDFENIARKLKDVRVSKGLTQEYIANRGRKIFCVYGENLL